MKVLLVSPHLPAPRTPQAGERFVFELIKVLSEKHEIHLVVRLHEGQEADTDPVRAYCKTIYPVFYKRPVRRDMFGIPAVVFSYYTLCRRANEIIKKNLFDIVHVEWTETGLFMRKKGKMFIDAHDVLSKPMERRYRNSRGISRVAGFVLYQLTRILERYIYAKFDAVFVRSEYDRAYLGSIMQLFNVSVLTHPAGIDISEKTYDREENNILFLAAMDRGPNVEAVLYFWNDILPLIRRRFPDVKFCVVGSRPLPEIRELADKDEKTIVTGFVEDIEPYYKKSTVFVAPLLTGGGIIVKILDALASTTPVVTTSIGNEGIGATPETHLLIGDTPNEFAEKVISLLEDKELRHKISMAGNAFIRDKFGRESLRQVLDKHFTQ